MAQVGQEELMNLLLDYEKQHGEKGGWLLIALGLVYLGQLIRLIETRAAILPVAPAVKSPAASGPGLGDLLGLLGPLMGSLKPPAGSPGAPTPGTVTDQPVPPAPPREDSPGPSRDTGGGSPGPSLPGETREATRPVKSNEVIKWDPRLVGGGRK